MYRIVLVYISLLILKVISLIHWLFEEIPGIGKLTKKMYAQAETQMHKILDYFTDRDSLRIANYCREVHTLKEKAEEAGDLRLAAKCKVEQSRIKDIFQRNNINNVSLNGEILKK